MHSPIGQAIAVILIYGNPYVKFGASLCDGLFFTAVTVENSQNSSWLYRKPQHISSTASIWRELLGRLSNNMPKIVAWSDSRVLAAVGYLRKYPNMPIPDAMKLANFTPEEIADKAKYQWVYRRVGKKASFSHLLVLLQH